MIKNEFKDNKVFKFPEEYNLYSQEQEEKIMFKLELEGKNDQSKKKQSERNEEGRILELIQNYVQYDEKLKYKEDHKASELEEQNEGLKKNS